MKLIFVALALISSTAVAAPQVTCNLEMYQVNVGPDDSQRSWGIAGDSNQRIDMTLSERDSLWVGTQDNIRFVNDQSEDDSPSRHGVRARVEYSESYFRLYLGALRYESNNPSAKSEVIGISATNLDDPTEESLLNLNLMYVNPKYAEYADLNTTIPDLVRAGKLANGDLLWIHATNCRLKN